MALSGTISKSITGRQYLIEWSATQSIPNNTSTITCVHKLVNNPTYSLYLSSGNVSYCDVGGVEKSYTNPAISTGGGTTHHLGTTVHTVSHNSDGTKSVTIKGTYNISATLSGTWTPSIVAEGTITLDPIPRNSKVSVSKTSADMGSSVTFTIDRSSTSFTHTLLLTWGGKTSTIATGVGASYAWTIPLSLANDLPSSTSSGCIITCVAYSGSKEISRSTLSMTLKVPSSVVPSISSVTAKEAVSDIASKFGALIQGVSRLDVAISAAGSYSSTIKSYSTTILGKTYSGSNFTSNEITGSGSVTVAVTVKDSRNRTATKSITVTVTPYAAPSIKIFTAQRCNQDGSLNDDGQYVKVAYSFEITSLSNKNSKSHTIRYKLKGSDSYTTLSSGSAYTGNSTISPTTTFSIDNSYVFELSVSDYFTTINYAVELSTGFTLVDYHSSGRGMGIGKVAEKEDVLEVALDSEFTGAAIIKGNRYAFSSQGDYQVEGYILMARITITATNADSPLTFVFGRRKAQTPMTVHIGFKSASNITPALNTIVYEGSNYGAFLIQSDDSIWDLYVQKASGFDEITLLDWYTTFRQMRQIKVTFPGTQITTLPQPYYRATPAKLQNMIDFIFPVNSVYISYSQVSPAELFGGTWTRIENRFLWGTTSGGTIGQTGGSQTHTLTVDEMPSHDHGSYYTNATTTNFSYAWLTPNGSAMGHGPVSAGGGKAHNNMPPYIQVSIWRRTA